MRTYCKQYQMSEKNSFVLVPWSEDFLSCIAELVEHFIAEKHCAMQDIVLVFPNIRPKRYLTARYKEASAKEKKVCLLPQMYTNTEFYGLCLQHFERGLPLFSELDALDSHALLHAAVKTILKKKKDSHFSSVFEASSADSQEKFWDSLSETDLELAKFFPWASALDKLFVECFHELILPQNIQYADGEVSRFAQSLLAELEGIFSEYAASMQRNGQTTKAYSLFRTAKYVQACMQYENGEETDASFVPFLQKQDYASYFADFMPRLLRGKLIIFAGFVQLPKAEEVILKYFWEHGACIALHSDSALAENKGHYSCLDHKKWAQMWQADFYLLPVTKKEKTQFSFLPAYDVHSQLAVLKKDIAPCFEPLQERDDYCAVVLPSSSLLMPVLHELPNKNINISLGYPVKRTLLWQFVQCIFDLQKNKRETQEGEYEYQTADVLSLLQHPYAKMLLGNAESVKTLQEEQAKTQDVFSCAFNKDDFQNWRKLLYYARRQLINAGLYVNLQEFVTDTLFDLDNENLPYVFSEFLEDFADEFFRRTVFSWESVQTMQELGARLNDLVLFVIGYGAGVWTRFPLDREAVARFVQNTVPAVMENGMAKQPLSMNALFGIVEELAEAERVPFEADPLTGVQVLGLLESRLLRFENVFLLECTENALPGMQSQDPLMPDSLRNVLGLPDRQSKERIIAHTFYRLINGAKNVYFYWQEGVQSSEMQSSKSVRSRFMEELIWEREKALQAEKDADTLRANILRKAACSPEAPKRRKKKNLLITPQIFEALGMLLANGLYASSLNAFLQCPVKFYYQFVAKIAEEKEAEAGNDFREFGTRVHALLNEQYQNKAVRHTPKEFDRLMHNFHAKFSADNWQECLMPDSYFMLQESGKFFLDKFWREEAEKDIEILELEHRFSVLYPHREFNSPIMLAGVADRVDKRGGSYWIVDYKATKKNKKQIRLWNDEEFFWDLEELNKKWNSRKAKACLDYLAEQMPDIQLPLYLYLFAKSYAKEGHEISPKTKINASWIFLAERGGESELALVDEDLAGDEDAMWQTASDIRETYMKIVLDFLLNFMAKEDEWQCRENKYCSSCPYREYC